MNTYVRGVAPLDPWRPDLPVERPADWRVLAAALAGGVMVDLGLRAGVAAVGGALAVAVAPAALVWSRRLSNHEAVALALAAPLFGVWLAVRTSPWLIPFDILAAGGLLVLAGSYARAGSVFDLTVPALAMRAVHGLVHGVAAPAFLVAPLARVRPRHDGERSRAAAIARGLLLAGPIVVVLGALLASADAVFASFLRVHLDAGDALLHAALIGLGGWALGGILRLASASPAPPAPASGVHLGRLEAVVVLGALDVLFGAFAAAQLVASSQGGRHVLRTAGLTYADYARSGFFQLVAAAAITFAVLVSLRALALVAGTGGGDRAFLVLAEVAIGLTFVIVMVALRRLDLYERAYGLTMLRLYVTVAAWCIAIVFVLLAAAFAGAGAGRRWLPAGVAITALAALLALNVANPEAVVARHNLARALAGHRFDPSYLGQLSPDAVPTLVAGLGHLGPADRAALETALRAQQCRPSSFRGWAGMNLDRRRAEHALAATCLKGP